MKRGLLVALMGMMLILLTGCAFLEREYSSVEPHNSTYYESGSSSVLKAEGYQDLVNDLLMLVSDHSEQGSIRYYPTSLEEEVTTTIDQACNEVQLETAIGAYALDYVTYVLSSDNRTYTQIDLTIAYSKTEEQMTSMIHATNISAIGDLLQAAAKSDASELVFQISHFKAQAEETKQLVLETWMSLGDDHQAATMDWQVFFYPNEEDAEIIEIRLSTGE